MIDVPKLFKRSTVPARWEFFDKAITKVEKDVLAAEVGVSAHFTNGLSTLYFANDDRVKSVYSIDIKPTEISRLVSRAGKIPKVTFIEGHSLPVLSGLPSRSINFLYLDGDADPVLTLYEYLVAIPKLKPGAIVLVDDFPTKAPLLYSMVKGEPIPFRFRHYGSWKTSPYRYVEVFEPEQTLGMLVFRHMWPPMIKPTD